MFLNVWDTSISIQISEDGFISTGNLMEESLREIELIFKQKCNWFISLQKLDKLKDEANNFLSIVKGQLKVKALCY